MTSVYSAPFPYDYDKVQTYPGTTFIIQPQKDKDEELEELRTVLKAIAIICNMKEGYSYSDLLRKIAKAEFEEE